ncbi:MAG: hypothetical protein ABI481_12490 [Pyrinomonadaceae bacterium]
MNCPNCGKETFADQQYCRSCGVELTDGRRRSFNPQAWGLFALMLIFGGMLIAMGAKIWAVKWLLFTGLVITFGGMFCIAALGLLGQTRRRKPKPMPFSAGRQPEIARADTTNKLLPLGENDFIPSVVEDTTELLKTPAVPPARR